MNKVYKVRKRKLKFIFSMEDEAIRSLSNRRRRRRAVLDDASSQLTQSEVDLIVIDEVSFLLL